MNWTEGQLVWFDPGLGHSIPGEIEEVHQAAQVITVKALIKGKYQSFTLQTGEGNLQIREDIGEDGLEDMTQIKDLHEASLLWNLRLRYEKGLIYTFAGSILVAVNPYKMIPETYGLEMAKQYAGKPLGSLPPHLFAIAAAANAALPYPQVVVISGESGSGKTESTKLVMQYLAAVVPGGGNASALINEQILEAAPLLESFGNARTVRNDNSSRFGKYLEVFFKSGAIVGAKITQYLLEKSRIVTQSNGEQNYHVFYEMLNGVSESERSKYGLLDADKYFYLNQGGLKYPSGRVDWQGLLGSMQVLGITENERESIIKVLSSVLHLGNIYFHRRQLRHGQEGVEIGSDAEIKWAAHLLQISAEGLHSTLTSRITETKTERLHTPLGIDQALDSRDAFAKALYAGLFNWLVSRINMILHKGGSHNAYKICILDIFGFESLEENSFEQLCINYANENLQLYFNKHVFKLEQAEYAKENLEWSPLTWEDNLPVIHLLAKKPVGIFHLLDDESNFPCGTDLSFLEKSHYNHALNDLYSRPRIGAQDFGINHYAGTVWYCVDGFLDKNRDYLRADVLELLESSNLTLVEEITKHLKAQRDYGKTLPKGPNGRFVTMKPRTPTVAARFSDSLQQLLQSMGRCNPWFVRCIKPNNDKQALKMDMPCVMQQLRYLGMLDTIKIRQRGYPVRLRFQHFVDRYRYILKGTYLHGTPYRDLCRLILDSILQSNMNTNDYQLGATRIFLREGLHRELEIGRSDSLKVAANVIQRNVRGMLVRRKLDRKNKAALSIQSLWRGHKERKKFKKLKKGVVKLQALHRGRVVRKRYQKMKRDLRYRKESSRSEQNHHVPIQIQNHVQKKSITHSQAPMHKKSDVNELAFLDVPAELSYLFKKVEDWTPVHGDRHLTKVAGVVSNSPQSFDIPNDVDQFAFGKFSSVYCNDIKLCPRSDPISTPFMTKAASKDQDFVDSIAIFKLILRWSKDESLRGNSEKMLIDYIISKGQNSYALRDEILVQLCNQLYGNPNEVHTQKLWFLMDQCLSSFKPSNVFKKYLLKFIIDNSPKNLTEPLVKKVLRKSFLSHRNFPTSWIEWRAFHKFSDIALCLVLPDETVQTVAIDSWTTCEEAASLAVQDLNINGSGWTVVLDDGKILVDSSGLDFVLDMISEVELFPSFPIPRNDLFKYGSKFDRFILPNGEVKRPQVPPPDPPKISITSEKSIPRNTHSQGRKLSNDILSRNSALNERYFEKEKSRSRSLDNLLLDDNEIEPEKDLTAFANIGLSKSKLNERYHSTERLNPTNNELTPRYTKYHQSGSRRSYASSHSKHTEKPEYLSRSSAMSDTSEAPSLASHVKRVRVPSQASDVDQFLDDLFRPVLDGSLDELSDARSLAASIRGRRKDDNYWDSIPISSDLNSLQNGSNISRQIKGGYSALDSVEVLPELNCLSKQKQISKKIKGGGTAHESASNSPELISAPQTPLSSTGDGYQDQMQRAFLQSAMAQNLQIQQQLLAQNQALQNLLSQQATNPGAVVQMTSTKILVQKPIIPRHTRKASNENGEVLIPPPPPPPMPPPIEFKDPSEARPFLDPYGRAKTVRIGKWRWPPPNSNQIHETEEDFLMFKMRQNQRKTTPQARFNGDDDDWQDFEVEKKKSVVSKEIITITMDNTDSIAPAIVPTKSKKKSFEVGAQRPPPGSVGKLKLSSEMRQRLEQLTAGHSVRSTVSKKSDHQSPSKLENTKRMLLEQQLGMVGVIPNHMSAFGDMDKWQSMPPAPSVAAPPPPIHPPNMAPPKPPPVPVSPGDPIKEYKQPSVPKYFQRQENDIFGARSEWESVEIAKEISEMSLMSMDQNRARSRSRSRDRDDFSESIWDRSEVEGHSLSDKEREKDKEKAIEDKSDKEMVSKRNFMPVSYKTTAKIETDTHSQITPSPTFKTHMVEKYEHERKIKTINRKENGGTNEWPVLSIPAPVPLPSSAKTSNTSLTYNRVLWKLRVRKEFFFPKEQVKSPAAIDLIFLQIVADVFETAPCLRLSMQEKNSAKNMLSSHGISVDNVRQQKIPISVKKYLIDMARSWALYFSRIFCVQGPPQYPDICVMAVSENGIYLARRDNDSFLVLHSFNFNNVDGAITLPRPTALQLNLANGNRIVLHTTRASIIQHMVSIFLQEYKQIHVKPVLEVRKSSSPQYPIKDVQRKRSEENFSYLNGGTKEMHHSSENLHKIDESRIQVMHLERAVKQRISKQENAATMDSNSELLSKSRKYTLMQFASKYFRNENENEELSNKKLIELVRWQGSPIRAPLLRLPVELSDLALECFECILRYCGDIPLDIHLTEVKCVYTVLMHCHKYLALRDEVYCQLMKQTTSNNSPNPDSIQRAWRLFSILAAYFGCSDALHPYLADHLSSIASDRRKPCYGTAAVCLANLRKTARCGGRKNVPSVDEVTAVSVGRSARRQIYRLPGGSERVVNTRCSTVVADVIAELCNLLGIHSEEEQQEFSLYCIVEGDAFTLPLSFDEYILDVTTELLKSGQPFYLIFCRSIWHFPLKRDPIPSPLYIEVLFNQVMPDYLEGLLFEMPANGALSQESVRDISRLAAILHRAADLNHVPTMKEIKFLLPKPILAVRDIRPMQWVQFVQAAWPTVADLSPGLVKAQFLNVLSKWPLFGSSFFAVKRIWKKDSSTVIDNSNSSWREMIFVLNRQGVMFLDPSRHETLQHWHFMEVISTRKVRSEDNNLFLDMKVGNLMQQRVIRVQTEQAHEISRLIRQYITPAQYSPTEK